MTESDDVEVGALLKASIRRNLAVLNRLESHLGCAVCRGPLTEGRCPKCQP